MRLRNLFIATFVSLVLWTSVVVAGAFLGWWREPIAPSGDTSAFVQAALERIERQHEGNTALVLIENGSIAAEHYTSTKAPVNRDTVFATASMSKWLAAWGVMKLVEDGKLDLDRPVDDYLSRWHLPESAFDNREVTTRRLLSHTAGLTDGLGFGDYLPNETVPTLEQSLQNPRHSSGNPTRIELGAEVNEWRYSGGGYLILELLIEEISGEPFDVFVERTVLQPLGMTRSGYDYPGDIDNSAKSYDADGNPAPLFRYASKAATGFVTSAGDMATFVLAHFSSGRQIALSQATMDAMRTPHASTRGIEIWGLGTMLYAPANDVDFVFGHDGANEPAINATVRINPVSRDGIVVLTTGNPLLASAIGSEWVFWQTGLPDFLSIPNEVKRVMPTLLGGGVVIVLLAVFLGWRSMQLRKPRQPRSD